MSQSKVAEVKAAAKGRWLEILQAVAPALKDACDHVGMHVPCPVAGGTNGFRLYSDTNETGGGVSNQHGSFKYGFELLMWVLDRDFRYVLNEVADYLQIGNGEWKGAKITTVAPPKPIDDPEKLKKCRYALRKAWQMAFDLTAPEAKIARKYLHYRGLDLKLINLYGLSKTIRFNPAMPLYGKKIIDGKVEQVYLGKHPAILSLISYSDGKVATIHRTYLGQNGQKIRFDEEGLTVESKMIMSRCEPRLLTGGAIQLASINTDIMHIAEGVETTLAVRQVLAYRGINEPVWSCVSSTLLQGFEPPKGIKHVVVWADKDTKKLIRGKMKEAGLDAATELAFRLDKERDIWVYIMYPQDDIPQGAKSVDWLDILVKHGPDAFPYHSKQLMRVA
ncbi:hypothetical protein FG064_16595 [Vibrio cholerae]|nr:hypothetical protein [Vibrio cholerae]GIB31710.1 hypothetical protein VCSRO91_2806 [Vibrio cholerae]